jgi:hypothetical protein
MTYVKLKDDVKVEVSPGPGFAGAGEKIQESLDGVQTILTKVAGALPAFWEEAGKHAAFEKAEIELGLVLKGEAGWLIAKASTEANLKVTITLARPTPPPAPKPTS